MVDSLIKLGKDLEPSWDRESFPQQALKALNNFKVTCSLETFEEQVAQWTLNVLKLPKQINLYNTFGEPPITFFHNGKFAVDVYFWRKNDTNIHSHAFRGAFKVIYGKSLHEVFHVETLEKFKSDMLNSKLTCLSTQILTAGDSQRILPGMELTHRVVHLENPTLTLCIRTVEDTQLNQWHHLSSGLSYTKYNLKEVNVKQILYFQYMYHSNSLTALKYLNELLTRMEASATLSLYESVFANEFGLDPVVSDIIIEHINNLCHEELWFQKFINHYDDLAYHLMEFNASSGDLKLLAHGLNFNFSAESIKNLLGYTENQELQQLTSKLLEEQTIFNDEYYGDQVQKINGFMYKLGDN